MPPRTAHRFVSALVAVGGLTLAVGCRGGALETPAMPAPAAPEAVAERSPSRPPAAPRTRPPLDGEAATDLPDRWARRLEQGASPVSSAGSPGIPTAVAPDAAVSGPPESAPSGPPDFVQAGGPDTTPAALLESGKAALRAGDLGRATSHLQAVPRDAPEAAEALHLLGVAAHRRGDLALARSHFTDAARRSGPAAEDAARALSTLARGEAMGESGDVERSTNFVLRVPETSRGGSNGRSVDVLRTLERALTRILRDLPTVPDRPIPVFVLSVGEFNQRFGVLPGMVLYGVYVPAERAIFVNDALGDAADRQGRDTLAHELTHALVDRATAGRTSATWLNEGFARYQGRASVDLEPVSRAEWAELRTRARNGTLPALESVRHSLGDGLIAYRLGAAACVFIEQRFGMHRIAQYLEGLRRGDSHDAAFARAFNGSEARFEADFRAWLKSR